MQRSRRRAVLAFLTALAIGLDATDSPASADELDNAEFTVEQILDGPSSDVG